MILLMHSKPRRQKCLLRTQKLSVRRGLLRQEASGKSLQREQTLREARTELERTRTNRDDWEAEAMAQRIRVEGARVALDATYRELAVVKEASERVSAARDAEAECANNLQAVLEDSQSGTSHISISHTDILTLGSFSLSLYQQKDHDSLSPNVCPIL